MAALRLSRLSTEYVHVGVAVTDGTEAIDPLSTTAELAFPAGTADPLDSDWKPATLTGTGTDLVAKALVGPGADAVVNLPAGLYGVWLRLTDYPEQPVRKAGTVVVS